MLFTRIILFAFLLIMATNAAPAMIVRDGDGQEAGSADEQANEILRAQEMRNQRMREALERERQRQAELARQREELLERLRQAEAEVADLASKVRFPRLP
ncbi:hypothetical protein OC846_006310 [Tilletia horrida]|uniref:Uncharacterized protein n=1 Tax=Tilletia horrida TaxID=155126 RepID=A0AAN6JV55_9BASI|nr:hypothetical protein OC845_006255 [Tilletia horrida]KAK0543732.1 hypothetical protein OC846_006310 [Tilletia horrida]